MYTFEQFLSFFSTYTGLQPETLLLLLGMVVTGSNLIARLIPDDATGWQGQVRRIAKVIGLYLSNRVSAGTSVNDVVNTVPQIVAGEVQNQIETAKTEALPQRNPFTGRFVKSEDGSTSTIFGVFSALIGLTILVVLLTGCTTTQQLTDKVVATACHNREKVQQVIDLAQAALNQCPSEALIAPALPVTPTPEAE